MSKTSKKQRRLIEEEEKALKKISELQDYVKELREARKKEEDVEILRTLRSLKLGAWDLYNLLTGIQEGTVIMEARPPALDQEDISEDAGDSALDKDGADGQEKHPWMDRQRELRKMPEKETRAMSDLLQIDP